MTTQYTVLRSNSYCLTLHDLSERGWQSLEKPLGTLQVANSPMCGVKCSSLGPDCQLFHYDKKTKDCTLAKVTQFHFYLILIFFQCQISCIRPEHGVQERLTTTILDKLIDVNIDSNIKPCPKGIKF